MKETFEFRRWLGQAANAIKRSLPKIDWSDLGNLIPPLSGITGAFDGFGKMGGEYLDATPGERDTAKVELTSNMPDFDENRADLIGRAADGLQSFWALGQSVGRDETDAAVAKLVKDGVLSVNAPGAASAEVDAAYIRGLINDSQ